MTSEFLNKKILITGASSGIGKSVATYFLNSGATVVLVGKDTESLKTLSKNFPNHSTIITCDLTKDIEIYDLKSSTIERLGSIDYLINCAGIKYDSDIEKTFPQDFDYTIDVNLRSVFLLIKSFDKFYNKNSVIINVSCLYGTKPISGLISYCISKSGLESFTKSSAGEFSKRNIRINCVSASPIISNSLRYARAKEYENELLNEKMKKNIPLGRIGLPDDIAKVIIFLCSNRASSITGKIIKVDGGRNLTSSGYVHYKGYKNMNSRFEPDDVSFVSKVKFSFNQLFNKDLSLNDVENMNDNDLEKFINDKISESNFSTRLIDAHKKYQIRYKSVRDNDEELFKKFTVKEKEKMDFNE
jgi:3-oxoacyl-[acyl-carrier protein] reductase